MEPYHQLSAADQALVDQYLSNIQSCWQLTNVLDCLPAKLQPKRNGAVETNARNLDISLLRHLSEVASLTPGPQGYEALSADWARHVKNRRKRVWGKGKNWLQFDDVMKTQLELEKEMPAKKLEQGEIVEEAESQGKGKRKRDEEEELPQAEDASHRSKRSRHSGNQKSVAFDNASLIEPQSPPRSAPGDINHERFPEASGGSAPVFAQRRHAPVARPARLPAGLSARIQEMQTGQEVRVLLERTAQVEVARARTATQQRIIRPQFLVEQQKQPQPVPAPEPARQQQQPDMALLQAQQKAPVDVSARLHPRDIPGISPASRIRLCKIRLAQEEAKAAVLSWQYDIALLEALAERDEEEV
ncbi:hypothetical protein BU26DRAFT_604400 [Trematosphaeria pertusa]|uniref:Uncharacterized protein n=1 Tax=Trematosphaeria pertusa TaxID=390896 RepID=A0A6A6IHX5_9PLEO|nr:uncharacterized protein BU26DRAFT_604400 [Trematosphaeria pertusa]KAF2250174.1 hypothetical protein BU26DRAFT_604400 [Trematosphaeria pertusa]